MLNFNSEPQFLGTLQPWIDTGADLSAWYYGTSTSKFYAINDLCGVENESGVTVALLESVGTPYLVVIYNTREGTEKGTASVQTTGADSTVLSDEPDEIGFPDMNHGWGKSKTDGFILAVTWGNKVCLRWTESTGLSKLRFLQADGTSAFSTTFEDLSNAEFCVVVPNE